MTTPTPLAECSAGHEPRSNVVDITSAKGRLLPVPFATISDHEPTIDAATVAALEMLLSRAKAGEIVAVAAVTATADGKFGTLFEYGGTPSGFALTADEVLLCSRYAAFTVPGSDGPVFGEPAILSDIGPFFVRFWTAAEQERGLVEYREELRAKQAAAPPVH